MKTKTNLMNVDKIRGLNAPIGVPDKTPPETHKDKEKKQWMLYKKRVMDLTEKVAHLLPGIEKRGFWDHHIDHKISIQRGFKLGIAPEIIAGVSNLRVVPYQENLRKGVKCV